MSYLLKHLNALQCFGPQFTSCTRPSETKLCQLQRIHAIKCSDSALLTTVLIEQIVST